MDLIYDRTQANSDRVATLTNKGWQNMTAEEQAEWAGGLKGAYNATDLNRVETAVAELSEILTNLPDEVKAYAEAYGVAWDAFFDIPYLVENIRTSTKTDWANGDIPDIEDMERYLSNVKHLRNALEYATDELPSSMLNLTWRGANAIEKALVNLDAAISEYREHRKDQIDRTAAVFVPSGVYFGGSVIYIARPKQGDDETTAVLGIAVIGSMILGNGG